MSRRPEKTNGNLVFQEGKSIEGEYYIIAVYDDPATSTLTFAAYELETDCTYKLAYTYTEFDDLFRYNSELMNPSSKDARYHHVIERLDFIVVDYAGRKTLCMAPEPTPDLYAEPEMAAVQYSGAALQARSVDAETRARLVQELDTFDDKRLQRNLVKSEEARHSFLSELFAKQKLERLKASLRLSRIDEDREQRLAKLREKKRALFERAARFKEEKHKKTQAQAELKRMLQKQNEEKVLRMMDSRKAELTRLDGAQDRASDKKRAKAVGIREQREVEEARWKELTEKRSQSVKLRAKKLAAENHRILQQVYAERERLTRQQHMRTRMRMELAAGRQDAMIARRQQAANDLEVWEKLELMRMAKDLEREGFRRKRGLAMWQGLRAAKAAADRASSALRDSALLRVRQAVRDDRITRGESARRDMRLAALREKRLAEREAARDLRLRKQAAVEEYEQRVDMQSTMPTDLPAPEYVGVEAEEDVAVFLGEKMRQQRREARGEAVGQRDDQRERKLEASGKYRDMKEVAKKEAAEEERRLTDQRREQARQERAAARDAARLAEDDAEKKRRADWERLQAIRAEQWKASEAKALVATLQRVQSRDTMLALDRFLPAF